MGVSFMVLAMAGSAGLVSARPALSSAEHEVVRALPPSFSGERAVPDGWEPRALVRRSDRAVVVQGPARAAPRRRGPTVPRLAAEAAIARVAAAGWPGASEAVLVITRTGRLAWRVDPPASLQGPRNPVFLVDASRGTLTLRHDRVADALVRAYPVNPILDAAPEDFEVLDRAPGSALLGRRIQVLNCVAPGRGPVCDLVAIEPSDAEDFLHPVPSLDGPEGHVVLEDEFAVQSVHHHAEVFLDWLATLGAPSLPCIARGEPATLLANYKAYVDGETVLIGNASYVGDCALTAAFGQGPAADWGYDGEVVYHELGHGVVERLMGEGRRLGRLHLRPEAVLRDAAAINEGVADFLASVVSGDPRHAEYVSEVGGGQGRRLDNTLGCPRSISGEIHADGEIVGAALWDAYLERGEPLVLAVLDTVALMPEDASLEEFGRTLVEVAAATLEPPAADVIRDALSARGLLECARVVAWDELERPLWIQPRGQGRRFEPMQPPPVQLAVPLPPDATGFLLRFAAEVLPTAGFAPVTDIHALVGFSGPIAFSFLEDDEGGITVDAAPDLHLLSIDPEATAEGTVIEAPGGQTIHLALFNQSPNVTLISEVKVEPIFDQGEGSSTGEPAEPDAEDIEGRLDDDGCACRHGRSREGWPAVLLLLLGFTGLRRRPVSQRRTT